MTDFQGVDVRQRISETTEEYRARENQVKRERYAAAQADGQRPSELIRAERRRRAAGARSNAEHSTKGPCTQPQCDEKILARKLCYRHYRASQRANGTPWADGSDPRRRAKRHGVEYEPVNKRTVYERDDWTCQLCNEPVDRGTTFPHPRSASLDHRVPMSKGGPHTYANTQTSHWECNLRKRDTL